jgi:hypothetical protein
VFATGSVYRNNLKAAQVTKSKCVKSLEEEQRQVQRSNSILIVNAGIITMVQFILIINYILNN